MTNIHPDHFTPCSIQYHHREGTLYSVTLVDDLECKIERIHKHLPLSTLLNHYQGLMGFSAIERTLEDLTPQERADTYLELEPEHRAHFVYPLDYGSLCAMVALTGAIDEMTEEVTQEMEEHDKLHPICV